MARKDELRSRMKSRLDEAVEELKKINERSSTAALQNTSDNDPEAEVSSDKPGNWSIEMPNDVRDVGTEVYTAPTSNPKRPRAYTIAYNHSTSTVVIIMRSGVWWQYNDVPVETWMGLRNSGSTNEYLPTLEGSCSSHHEASIDALSSGTKARLNSAAMSAERIQKGNVPTWQDVYFGGE